MCAYSKDEWSAVAGTGLGYGCRKDAKVAELLVAAATPCLV